MPLLELYLPLDPLLVSSHWAWLIALLLATVATFSRLPPFSSHMDSPPLSTQIKLHETPPSEEDELSASEPNEVVCEGQARVEKKNPWSTLHLPHCGAGEEDGKREEEEEKGGEVLPSWVSSLLEASHSQPAALLNSTPALEAPRACISCVQETSWSRGLHRQISARMGVPWQHRGPPIGMSLYHQARPPCVAENVCIQHAPKKMWSCQELQMLQVLQALNMQFTISAIEVGRCDGVAHLGFCNGEIALWDVEKRVCANYQCDRAGALVAALFVSPSHPRLAIATGRSVHNQTCSIVSVWDDRCTLYSGGFVLPMPARRMRAFECRAYELGIAREGYVTRHDLRMLKGHPIAIHGAEALGKAAWQWQGNKNRGADYGKSKENCVNGEREEETDEFLGMGEVSSDYYYEGKHASKRSFLTSCLPFLCCLVQTP